MVHFRKFFLTNTIEIMFRFRLVKPVSNAVPLLSSTCNF